MEYVKAKSAAKVVQVRGQDLSDRILKTMKTISDVVGATLGPGGMPILIERQENNLPGLVTKDGVTVFRSLGFSDPVAQVVMETARDAAVRTVSEAGDGTTTATVLAEAIVRYTNEYVKRNPTASPQKIVRRLEDLFRKKIEPLVQNLAITPAKIRLVDAVNDEEDTFIPEKRWNKMLHSVAQISANGDSDLADAVMECFRLVGDEGNVTLVEMSGPSSYQVERVEGFPIPIGFEESCVKFMQEFVNDAGNQRVLLNDRPAIVLYNGAITDVSTCFSFLMKVAAVWERQDPDHTDWKLGPNIVLVATGFSESVLGWLALNFKAPHSLNVLPLLCPRSPVMNGEYHFLQDLSATTGAKVMNPINDTFDSNGVEALGFANQFEMYRFRSTVFTGPVDPKNPTQEEQDRQEELLDRVEQLQTEMSRPDVSRLDKMLIQERVGKLTGGIARLKVIGASNGELKEKRDRAEDAVCAVRGAIKHGVVPGGGWTLLKIAHELNKVEVKLEDGVIGLDPIVQEVLNPALAEPIIKLLLNVGMTEKETENTINKISLGILNGKCDVYDALERRFVDAVAGGVLDSRPAVLEAIRNSISIAALLGTLGGVVVFKRDDIFERSESTATSDFLRSAGVNEADERV